MKHKSGLTLIAIGLICMTFLGCMQNTPSVSQENTTQRQAERPDAELYFAMGARIIADSNDLEQDYQMVIPLWHTSAMMGNASAQAGLGACYFEGVGVPINYQEAVKWYRRSARQGKAEGQLGLGHCYYTGKGVPENLQEAMKWFRRSAEQGSANAQLRIAIGYYLGDGIPQNFAHTYAWADIATTQGNQTAGKLRTECLTKMTSSQIAEGKRLSREYTKKFGL